MTRRTLDIVVGDIVQRTRFYTYLVTYQNGSKGVVESSRSLPEMYASHEFATTIEECRPCPWCGAPVAESIDCPKPADYCSHD